MKSRLGRELPLLGVSVILWASHVNMVASVSEKGTKRMREVTGRQLISIVEDRN